MIFFRYSRQNTIAFAEHTSIFDMQYTQQSMNRNYNLNEPPGREQVKVLYYTGCGLLRHCQAYKIVTHANRFEKEKTAKTAGGKKPENRNAHPGRRI